MDDVREKLGRCFALVFPKLDPGKYATASAENTSEWDSLTHVTLLTLIGEEFEREIDFEDFEGVTTFEALERVLQVK
jgi:acyl carrier protein